MFQPNDRVTVHLSGLVIQGVSFSQNVQKAGGSLGLCCQGQGQGHG